MYAAPWNLCPLCAPAPDISPRMDICFLGLCPPGPVALVVMGWHDPRLCAVATELSQTALLCHPGKDGRDSHWEGPQVLTHDFLSAEVNAPTHCGRCASLPSSSGLNTILGILQCIVKPTFPACTVKTDVCFPDPPLLFLFKKLSLDFLLYQS